MAEPSTRDDADPDVAVLYAQQPIFDTNLNVAASELLFRGDFATTSGEAATATVLCNALDQDCFSENAEQPIFINFTAELLANPPPLRRSALVIEVLETIEPTPDVLLQVGRLKAEGYQIALDDLTSIDGMEPLLALADVVKVEVLALAESELRALAAALKPFDVRLLAEKVETHECYELCVSLGFELFQGYFFARPQLVEGRRMGPSRSAVLELLAALQAPDLDATRLERLVLQDSGLTLKVLQLVNSAENRRAATIETVRHAINMLGLDKIRTFASLLALSGLKDRPLELQRYAASLTELCRRLGTLLPQDDSAAVLQTTGMLSTCPAYFDMAMQDLVPSLPISAEVRQALVAGEGPVGMVLNTARSLLQGRHDQIDWVTLETLGLDRQDVVRIANEQLFASAARE
ncbi:MAG: HDOD domain-containing protein [Pseudomonadota bacterium]